MIILKNGVKIQRVKEITKGYSSIGNYYIGIKENGDTYGFTDLDMLDDFRNHNVSNCNHVGDIVEVISVDKHATNNWNNNLVKGLTGVIDEILYFTNPITHKYYVTVTIKLDIKSQHILADRCNNLNHLKGWNHNRITIVNPIFERDINAY